MKPVYHFADPAYVALKRQATQEILAASREFRTKEAMAEAKDFVLANSTVLLTPQTEEDLSNSYSVDDEGVAHVNVTGELVDIAEQDICGNYAAGGTTEYGAVIAATQAAGADPRVLGIVYHFNSPGGSSKGVEEAADAIRFSTRPTLALCTYTASAAYWLASQCDLVGALSRSSSQGSIGVVVEYVDPSKAMEAKGYRVRTFTSTDAPYKRLDLDTDEGVAHLMAHLDEYHELFASAVAVGRGTTTEHVNSEYGRGGMMLADRALSVGMIDFIGQPPNLWWEQQIKTTSAVGGSETAAVAAQNREAESMDIKTLKNDHPDVYDAAVADGVKIERARVAELHDQLEADPDNPQLQKVVSEAILEGKTVAQVQTKLIVAVRQGAEDTGENPAKVPSTTDSEDEDTWVAQVVNAANGPDGGAHA